MATWVFEVPEQLLLFIFGGSTARRPEIWGRLVALVTGWLTCMHEYRGYTSQLRES